MVYKPFKPTLQRNEGQQNADAKHRSYTNVSPQEVEHNDGLQGADPEEVDEDGADVEASDVVGQKIYHLSHCCLPKSSLAQPQGLTFRNIPIV